MKLISFHGRCSEIAEIAREIAWLVAENRENLLGREETF